MKQLTIYLLSLVLGLLRFSVEAAPIKPVVNYYDSVQHIDATTANHCPNWEESVLPILEFLNAHPDLSRVEQSFQSSMLKLETFPQFSKIKDLVDPASLRIAFQMKDDSLELAAYFYDPKVATSGYKYQECWHLGTQITSINLYKRGVIGKKFVRNIPEHFETPSEDPDRSGGGDPYRVAAYDLFEDVVGYADAPMVKQGEIVYEFKEEFLSTLLDKMIPALEKIASDRKAEAEELTSKKIADDKARVQAAALEIVRVQKLAEARARFKDNR